ncbi:Methylcrotonyl-CoA carboxylase biotin-containing subunit [hydrothermal vent metagenome]|uniref:Methylcrotonyl-CoA carboxylase biotin-containing subunit n=1 Tax=hydrothermal vent metagenome TaxID=652676 RepID=A0A3B0SV65_9ZZZZ
MAMISSLLIANRGEIACRIIRTAQAMGVRTVAVYSEADKHAAHVRAADEAVLIGPAPAAESYLKAQAIVEAAKATGARAIHPGYGFLAENADFAEAVAKAGLVFVGPPPGAIRAMGAKDAAKRLMEAAGVPVVPGFHGEDQQPGRLADEADQIGYPVMIKAALGGGGKGMRRVDGPEGFAGALEGAKREARAAFGDDRVIIERFISSPRHIEVQVFADGFGNIVHLFERDCSLQRRHQKVIEEAPAPGMTEALRAAMTDAAIAAAGAVGYVGAGTVEFILDGSSPLVDGTPFFFMEMNTRLQVEHPVTEFVTGIDLVEWQLRVAAGEALPARQVDIAISGHAVEARLYAENPGTGFLPATGRVLHFQHPTGPGLRIDAGLAAGDTVTSHYDPMIAKIIAHGETRTQALSRLDGALARLEFAGPQTNQSFLRHLLADQAFVSGRMDTGLIDARLPDIVTSLQTPPGAHVATAVRAVMATEARRWQARGRQSPWSAVDAFQLGPPRIETRELLVGDNMRTFRIVWDAGVATVPELETPEEDMTIVADGAGIVVVGGGTQLYAQAADPFDQAQQDQGGSGTLLSPMPGLVSIVEVEDGQQVTAGQRLLVLEAMKMEHAIKAPFDGTVSGLAVAAGDRVGQGDALVIVAGLDAP